MIIANSKKQAGYPNKSYSHLPQKIRRDAMKTYTKKELNDLLDGADPLSLERDNYGQLIIYGEGDDVDNDGQAMTYTGVFLWSDGSFKDSEES